MSFYEDFVADGLACYSCCIIIFDGPNGEPQDVGFPRLCKDCQQIHDDLPAEPQHKPAKRKHKRRKARANPRAQADQDKGEPA